jgi:hypothetical protein
VSVNFDGCFPIFITNGFLIAFWLRDGSKVKKSVYVGLEMAVRLKIKCCMCRSVYGFLIYLIWTVDGVMNK